MVSDRSDSSRGTLSRKIGVSKKECSMKEARLHGHRSCRLRRDMVRARPVHVNNALARCCPSILTSQRGIALVDGMAKHVLFPVAAG